MSACDPLLVSFARRISSSCLGSLFVLLESEDLVGYSLSLNRAVGPWVVARLMSWNMTGNEIEMLATEISQASQYMVVVNAPCYSHLSLTRIWIF